MTDKEEGIGFDINWSDQVIYMSEEDYAKFIEALENAPEPSEKLKEAYEKYKLGISS